MVSPSEELKIWFATAIESAVSKAYPNSGIDKQQVLNSISVPKKEYGDMSSSVAIRLSKIAKKSPKEVAAKIIAGISKSAMIREVNEAGGYINASFNEAEYSKKVFEAVNSLTERYGSSDIGGGEKVITEYPSLNPNKPYVVSHFRNALIGDSVANILEFCSYKVEREDYVDNLGLQMAETLWGWKNLSCKPDKKFDQWLGEQYIEVNRAIEERGDALKAEIQALLKKVEDTDTEDSKLLREIAERCLKAQRETLFRYGIYHDVLIWESDIVRAKLLEKALELGLSKGIFEKPSEGKYAGCIVVKLDKITRYAKELEGSREDSKVIIRSNGAATYIAKDFAFHLWKFGLIGINFKYVEFLMQPDGKALFTTSSMGTPMDFGGAKKVINVIGNEQNYEQKIIKVLFSLLGREDISGNLVHLSYGLVNLEGVKLSTRKGTWIDKERSYTADVLLEDASAKALEATKKSGKLSDPDKAGEISEEVGKAAIRFEFLKLSPQKPITFSWESALSFEGNSGPYCLYSYARARRILRKGGYGEGLLGAKDYRKVTGGYDFELVKLIGCAEERVRKAATDYGPDVIAEYVSDLTSLFSKFYESMPVINSDAKNLRMELIHVYMTTLSNMLMLLGIRTVEEM